MSNFLYSYTDFIRDRINFKKVDKSGPNRFDSPASLYYKIVFYFSEENGLLGINNINVDNTDTVNSISKTSAAFTGNNEAQNSIKNNVFGNTAYNYLLLNDELERAEYLKKFLMLLSDISSDSPWYFQEITGLDAALERKVFSDGELKLEDKPRQITIKCLNDAYDNRIGMLLDLYRAACFSYQNKKEIVPANLRKFNMGILVFNAPIRGKGGKSGDPNNMILIPDSQVNFYIPSCKLIELRNCEFEYNSAKSAFATLNTTEDAFSPEYTITINYDDCYESRYNEIAQMVITDFINIDIRKERIGELYEEINASGVNPLGNEIGSLKYTNDYKEFWTDKTLSTGGSTDNIENVYKTNIVSDYVVNTTSFYSTNINSPVMTTLNQTEQTIRKATNPGNILKNTARNLLSTGRSELRNLINKYYIGNIYGNSVREVLSNTNRVLSGDVTPVVGFIRSEINKSKTLPDYKNEERQIETNRVKEKAKAKLGKLPQYDKEYLERINATKSKINTAKSIRNNL